MCFWLGYLRIDLRDEGNKGDKDSKGDRDVL